MAKENKAKRRIRIQLECTDKAMSFVQSLRLRTGATSTAEVVRRSLEAYNWMLDYLERGYKLRFVRKEEIIEAYLPPIITPSAVQEDAAGT